MLRIEEHNTANNNNNDFGKCSGVSVVTNFTRRVDFKELYSFLKLLLSYQKEPGQWSCINYTGATICNQSVS